MTIVSYVPEWRELFAIIGVVLAFHFVGRCASVLRLTGSNPGFIAAFPPLSFLPLVFFPQSDQHNLQRRGMWTAKRNIFQKYNSTVIVVPSLFSSTTTVLVGDAAAMRVVNSGPNFAKSPLLNNKAGYLFGHNLLTTVGEDWKRHRRVTAHSFADANAMEVWSESTRLADEELFPQFDRHADASGVAVIQNVENVMATTTLMVMSKAAFGVQLEWPNDAEVEGTTGPMSLYGSLKVLLRYYIHLTILPEWAFSLPSKKLKHIHQGFKGFGTQIQDIINKRRAEENNERHDLLGALVAANALERGKNKLSDQEIIADAYLFLFAGHETTANTLSAALFLLALYPPHQDQLHDEARDAFGDHAVSDASFVAYSSLKYTLAVFEEALRILGPVLVVSKVSVNDTILPAHTYPSDGSPAQATQVVVPKGSLMRLAIAAIHNNPNFWSDPDEFRPARFLNRRVDGGAQDEAWVPFSTGTRGCIGKNFALTEGVAILASIMLRYTVEVPQHLQEEFKRRPTESEQERFLRLYKPDFTVTLHPNNLELAFRRRPSSL